MIRYEPITNKINKHLFIKVINFSPLSLIPSVISPTRFTHETLHNNQEPNHRIPNIVPLLPIFSKCIEN